MKINIYISLICGGLAYIITVLTGILRANELEVVFKRGLKSLIIFFLIALIFSIIPEIIKQLNYQQENNFEAEVKPDNDKKEKTEDNEDQFSPLEPPVLDREEND